MRPHTPPAALPFVAAACITAPAAAQITDAPPNIEQQRLPGPELTFSVSGLYNDQAGLDTGGELSVARVRGDLDLRITLDRRTRLRFNFETFQSFYDTDGVGGTLVPGRLSDPFDTVHQYDLYFGIESSISGEWSWFAGGRIASAGETGADFADTLTYGGLFGARYQATDALAIGIGVLVTSQLEDDVFVIPIPTIDWQIAEGVRLYSEFRRISLGFDATDDIEIGAWVRFDRHEFRLNDDPGTPEGVVRETTFPVGFFAEYAPTSNITVRGEIGGTVYGEFEILDSAGNEVVDTEIDTALVLGLHVNVSF